MFHAAVRELPRPQYVDERKAVFYINAGPLIQAP